MNDTEAKQLLGMIGLANVHRLMGFQSIPDILHHDLQHCPVCGKDFIPSDYGKQSLCKGCWKQYDRRRKHLLRTIGKEATALHDIRAELKAAIACGEDGLTDSDKEVIRRLNKAAGIIVTGTDAEAAKILDGSLDCEENVSYTPDGETG